MIRSAITVACTVGLTAIASASPASKPWFGTWVLKPTDASQKGETLIYSDAGDGAMRMQSLEDRSVLITHFDGRSAAITEPRSTHRHALAIKSTSPLTYTWTMFADGKPLVRGRNVLAPDRKSFVEKSWLIARPDQVLTFIYEAK